jgi:hypothetical protein
MLYFRVLASGFAALVLAAALQAGLPPPSR